MDADKQPLRIGLIGFGCVGQGFYNILQAQPDLGLAVTRIAVKSPNKPRTLPAERFSYHADALLHDPELDLLVEVIDDPDEAFRLVGAALRQGRRVVTANKAMLARHLPELVQLQVTFGGTLLYEAAVCGSIPVIRTLDNYFSHEPLHSVSGIFNGSSNYVLTRMSEEGSDYGPALAEAQEKGFAETDPTLDMGAFDPRSKAVILAAHAYGVFLDADEVLNLGIEGISAADIARAAAQGRKIKVVAAVQRLPNGHITALVTPQLVGPDSPLYTVEREFNGVAIEAAYAGTQFLTGRGAGGHPTGSAELEIATYVSHPDASVLREVLTWLELPAEALHTDAHGAFATGPVAVQQLWSWRKELRTNGVFIAREGAVRVAAPVAEAVAAAWA
jgi:homoserine dehydrogenase